MAEIKSSKILIIDSTQKMRLSKLSELWTFKDLLLFWIIKDVKIKYGQTYLGIGWAVLSPVLNMAILTLVFHKFAGIQSKDIPYPLFCLIALLAWSYFSNSMSLSAQGLISSSKIISKVYFPRLFIPFTPLFSRLVDFVIGLLFILFFIVYYKIAFTVQLFFFPVIVLLLFLTTAGSVLWFSSLSLQYRDIKYAGGFIIQLLMSLSPIVFPASLVKEKMGDIAYLIYGLYPLVGIIEGFRATLTGLYEIPWELMISGSVGAILLFLSGFVYFQTKEKIFADL